MEELSPENITRTLKRFYDCTDGLIRRVAIDLTGINSLAGGKAEIEISVRDSTKSGEWVNILWVLSGLREFHLLEETDRTNEVLSPHGMTASWHHQHIYLDFSPYTSTPENLEDVRHSDLYLGGKKCHWKILPYSE